MTSKVKRSKFEETVGEVLEQGGFSYEPYSIPYTTKSKYTPDFVFYDLLVEVKGWFRPGDTKKYKAIGNSLEEGQELVFLLQYPHKKVRKGGKITMSEWCTKEGFLWFSSPEGLVRHAIVAEEAL